MAGSTAPYGADFYDTSEFFVGDIAIGVLILESAAGPYNWSDSEIDVTLNGIVAGMDWWVTRDPRSERTFTYDFRIRVPVSTEPIQGSINDDWTWGDEALASMGYSAGNAYQDGKQYLNDLRDANGTDWATMMFVVDCDPSVNQGLFQVGGGYAHSYFGGPWLTMSRFSSFAFNAVNYYTAVPAHETGHSFYATDEYDSTPRHNGYFNGLDNDGAVCIMNQNSLTGICDSSKIQIGWRYSAGDTIDILNVPPVATLGAYLPDPSSDPAPEYLGAATAGVLPNVNPSGQAHAITLNSISLVEYSVDGGPWAPASPSSSPWDYAYEPYEFNVPSLLNGAHTISARATDDLGHRSATASDALTIVTGGIVVTADSLLFDANFVGVPDTLLLRVVNNSIDTAHIAGASVIGADFSFPGSMPSIVAPFDSIDYPIVYLPASPGASSGFLELAVTDPVVDTLIVQLGGLGIVRPTLVLDPESLYVSLAAGDTALRTIGVSAGSSASVDFSVAPAYPGTDPVRLLVVELGDDTKILIDSLHLPYTLVSAAGFDTVSLNNYDAVLFGSTTNSGLLAHLSSRRSALRQFVANGGGVAALSEQGTQAWKWLPDSLTSITVGGDDVTIDSVNHPVMEGQTDSSLSDWEFSYYNVFDDLPAGSSALASTGGGTPVVVAWDYGVGRILVSGLHHEQYHVRGYPAALEMVDAMIRWVSRHPSGWADVDAGGGSIPGVDSTAVGLRIRSDVLDAGIHQAAIVFGSNDPLRPEFSVPLTLEVSGSPSISADTDSIGFGDAFIAYPETVIVRIVNSGTDSLRITDIGSSSPAFAVAGPDSIVIAPHDYRDLSVIFTPAAGGSASGMLTITSDDPIQPTLDLAVNGNGLVAPLLGTEPEELSTLAFEGDSASVVLTMSNTGAGPLNYTLVDGDPEGERVGDTLSAFSVHQQIRGNVYTVQDTAVLTGFGAEVQVPLSTTVQFIVYESAQPGNGYQRVYNQFVEVLDAGSAFRGTGGMSLPLFPGKYYFIAIGVLGDGSLFATDSALPRGVSFGTLVAGGSYVYGNTFNNILPGMTGGRFWRQSVSVRGIHVLAIEPDTGTIAPDSSREIAIRMNTGLPPGRYSTVLTISANNPSSPVTKIPLSIDLRGRSVSVRSGWNMLSAPFFAADRATPSIFPGASGPAYGFEGVYEKADTIQRGRGYWLKFGAAAAVEFEGAAAATETVGVDKGWNIVGSVSLPLPVSAIGSIPPAIITTGFYHYDGDSDYSVADTLVPGEGYWVKANQSGALVLSTAGAIPTAARIRVVASAEMPPPPPEGSGGTNEILPKEYAISQNYPNPFNPTTTITYALPAEGLVQLRVFNVLGEEVARPVDGFRPAGYYSVEWDAGAHPGGVYFYTIRAGSYVATRKMLLIK